MHKVCIVMSTYNGARYLRDQLDSLLAQEQDGCHICVRDDGSTDGTAAILREYAERHNVEVWEDCNVGPARSFLTMLKKAPDAEYFAFCDQDDVWLPGKLLRALQQLERNCQSSQLGLYFSDYTLVNQDLQPLKGRKFDLIPMTLSSILTCNCAVGATMVITRSLREKICAGAIPEVQIHDWWALLVCLAFNGMVVRDDQSYLLYRQHESNVIGCSRGLFTRILNKMPWGNAQRKMKGARRNFALKLLEKYDSIPSEYKAVLRTWAYYDRSVLLWLRLVFSRMAPAFHGRLWIKGVFFRLDAITRRI